jgi:hypothetical protein
MRGGYQPDGSFEASKTRLTTHGTAGGNDGHGCAHLGGGRGLGVRARIHSTGDVESSVRRA